VCAVGSGAPIGVPAPSRSVNRTRLLPQTSSPGLATMIGVTGGGVPGGAQPGRSSATLGAVWHAAVVEAPGEPTAPLAGAEEFGLQADAMSARQVRAASATARRSALGG